MHRNRFFAALCLVAFAGCYTLYCKRKQHMKSSINIEKHMYQTKNLEYAHYSKITKHSYVLFPELLLTKKQSFVLKKGQSLFIPKGWWHWVETMCPTFAINHWISEKVSDKPYVKNTGTSTNVPDHDWFDLIEDIELECWDEDQKKSVRDTLANLKNKQKNNNVYVCSIDAYPSGRFNKKQLEPVLAKFVVKPHPKAEQPNFWISIGYHDTGLHFDDKDGILTVLDGQKNIKLFPPEDAKLLHPFPLKPEWAHFKTNKIVYANEFRKDQSLSQHINQGAELYTFLNDKCKERNVFAIIDKLYQTYGPNKVVWGLKKSQSSADSSSGERLEFYLYHFKNTEVSYDLLETEDVITKSLQKTNEICKYQGDIGPKCDPNAIPKQNLMIHSFDVFLKFPCIDSKVHLYYKDSLYDNGSGCFLGHGTNIDHNNNVNYEGLMYGCHWSKSLETLNDGFQKIQYIPNHVVQRTIERLIRFYPCRLFFIWNKPDYLLIQFCTLDSTSKYVDFLRQYDYSPAIIEFINTNEDYHSKNISHDIGLSMDKKTGAINRTAIYGII
jgi:hypothetical protein